jgi:hypothetical protein
MIMANTMPFLCCRRREMQCTNNSSYTALRTTVYTDLVSGLHNHDHLPTQPDPALAVNGSEANVVIKLAPNDLKSSN